jgi:Flp pilus assembly protein TadG
MITRGRYHQYDGINRLRNSRAGQAQIEFVLSILFALVVFVSIVEMILLMYTYTVLADAAKEGVRYAIVHGCSLAAASCSGTCTPACTDTAGANVTAYARNYLGASLHDPTAMTVNVSYPDSSSLPANRVRVTVSYPYQPFFGLSWPTVTVRAAAEGRIFF